MNSRAAIVATMTICSLPFAPLAKGDTIQLINGDRLHGKVALLNEQQLVLRSESFGELKIPRAKIELIALGDKGLPDAKQTASQQSLSQLAVSPQIGTGLLGQVAPLLQNSAAQKELSPMIDRLLGAGGVDDLQKNIGNARRGLQGLKKDLGPGPESQALDGYLNILNLLGAAGGPDIAQPPQARPVKPPAVKKPANAGNKPPTETGKKP